MKNKTTLVLFLLFLTLDCFASQWESQIIKQLNGGSIIVKNPMGQTIFSYNADKYRVPASILKIATADAVISTLGDDYRIKTEFFISDEYYLGIKGYGDPTLVSESLALIAKQIKINLQKSSLTKTKLKGFLLDTSFFKPHLKVHGQSTSNNPYDSSIGALLANFNTIHIKKSKNGIVTSAESQTPLTSTAVLLSKKLSPGKHRINIGQDTDLTLRYFTELLQYFLNKEGISIPIKIVNKSIPSNSTLILTHQSKPVTEIIKNLLKFSNNLIANQLLVILGGETIGIPADLDKGKHVVSEFLSNNIGIKGFILEEGSGLSRKNQFTAKQMMAILLHFKPYQHLLRIDNNKYQAKTGTLKGVSTYAGYLLSPIGEDYPFVIMINKSSWSSHRKKVANKLYQGLFN